MTELLQNITDWEDIAEAENEAQTRYEKAIHGFGPFDEGIDAKAAILLELAGCDNPKVETSLLINLRKLK